MNRVGARFNDQSVLSGHDQRLDDLDRFAQLGIAALRYPVLWERIAPDSPESCDWRWTDTRLVRLHLLGVRPIAGLVHHGSGPHYTDLLADGFAQGLASFAGEAARRYPWIEDWTPVNEPLTTARFSALYGHWYPHARDEFAFWTALLNQIDATRLSMRQVRLVNPAARLIQTEDLGRTWSTVPLRHQAGFDNVRRWMSWDLLCGRVLPEHPLWNRLANLGLSARLAAIADDPCPPDVIGVNHYLTSDRFLDHRIRRYPLHALGGNDEQRYADVEAIRVLEPAPAGLEGVLREAWQRYGIPIAVTEVHNGCSRDEQMRWLAEAWQAAVQLREEGMEIRAVTNWALLGSHGWNTLLTSDGRYEPGTFDMRGGVPVPTALAAMLPRIASGEPHHAVTEGTGWWRRPMRLLYPAVARAAPISHAAPSRDWSAAPATPLMICGASGTLGQAFGRACAHRNIAHVLLDRRELDLTDAASISAALETHRPWAVINATGWVRVDAADQYPHGCFAINTHGAIELARQCALHDVPTATFSSDLVFDGSKGEAYLEEDRVSPLGVYGASKAAAERGILGLDGAHLIVRTAAFFSPDDPHNFAMQLVGRIHASQRFAASATHVVSPTYVPHLCDSVLDLLIDGSTGLRHVSGDMALSWHAFAERLALRCGLDERLLEIGTPQSLGWTGERPKFAGLGTSYGRLLPALDEAIDHFADRLSRATVQRVVAGHA